MITHGILTSHGIFDMLKHELDEISKSDIKKQNKVINWKETKVYDNSNRGQKNQIIRRDGDNNAL